EDERVDLGDGAVVLLEEGREPGEELREVLLILRREAEGEGELAALVALEADGRVDEDRVDLLGRLFGDLLDLDAALGGGHHGDALGLAVDDEGEVELHLDAEALLLEE